PNLSPAAAIEQSYAGMIGKALVPLMEPLGYNWEHTLAIISSFAAREVFVSTLATVYNLQSGEEAAQSLVSILHEKHLRGEFSLATALSLLVFFVLACQCTSTLAACKKETNSWAWTVFLFSYSMALAYLGAWVTFNVASYLS
ncbi:MAG: ferrous iron transporter B, partial [SAR324 cluster bacterium]|nr:ferrous iron transporter B [SAR324 cluster bacterium]